MTTLTNARQAKTDKFLTTLIRTSAYGICTRAQRLDQAIADGATIEAAQVRDEARERAIEREIQQLKGRDGWGIPTGNECHPKTIQLRKLQKELADGPMCVEYRLNRPDGEYWNVITKTEFEYAKGLVQG
jgi:hypothetical protein